MEAGNRVAYLKFNISGLSGSVRSATLQLRENGDLGSGTLRVYRGSHNSWTETSLTAANAPSASGQVGTSSGSVSAAQIVNINVTSLIPNNGTYTAIIKMDAGGNDIWFGSEESARKPRLIVETGGSAASAYTLTVNNGSGSGSYAAGTTLNLVAASAPSGQVFDRWTGDVGTVANVNTGTTTMTMPAANATVTATYRAVSAGGTFTFAPTDDAYLQGTTRFNDAYLKVEAGNRVAYLKFNISGLSGSVRSATLQLRENGDLGSGTLRVYRGSHNSWTETSLTAANAPSASGQVGTSSGSVSAAQIVSIDVTSLITDNGIYTVIVKMDAGGNDIWFGSEESARKPRLIVETVGRGVGTSTYTLTVNSGTGSGSYPAGSTVDLVAASAPSGQEFDRWTGDVGTVVNVSAATTTLTMPAADATVTATYRDLEATPVEYTLTVNSGTGSGSYAAGSSVDLVAASAPSGQEFDRWTGDVGNVANVSAAMTTLTMPAADATVTATYRDLETTPVEYTLTVNSGTGTGSYAAGATVDLVAASAPSGQEFDRWTGDVGNVANVNAATTTLTMPAVDATVTATYRAVERRWNLQLCADGRRLSAGHDAVQ